MAIKGSKAKIRFNFIDALLILIILAAVAALVWIFGFSSTDASANQKQVEIEYTVRIKKVRDEFRGEGFFNEGDPVTDSATLYDIGNLVSAEYSKAEHTAPNKFGELVVSEYPNHIDITLTVRATADITGGVYNIGGYTMTVGKKVSLRVPNFVGEGYCTAISEVVS
jgi:hypothetical protein